MMMGIGIAAAGLARGTWWPQGAAFAVDFASQRAMRDGSPVPTTDAYTFERASVAWAPRLDGVHAMFEADRPRIVAGHGVLLESASANKVPNSAMAGAALGEVGAGGALPDDWSIPSVFDAVTVVDFGTGADGLPFIDLEIVQDRTAAESGFPQIAFAPSPAVVPAEPNVPLCGSFGFRVIARDPSDTVTTSFQVVETYTEAIEGIAAAYGALPDAAGPIQTVATSNDADDESVANVRFRFQAQVYGGLRLHRTIRIVAPQLEPDRTAPSSPIVTSGEAAVRAADGLALDAGEGSFDWHIRYGDGTEAQLAVGHEGVLLVDPEALAQHWVAAIWAVAV